MKLNLEAKNKEQELIKAYLEENASETLAEKINNGTPFEKDGKTFINKKTLDGFIEYATSEARKLASKGANSACIEGEIICGWAIHYFEEQSLEGTLYNLDGTEYKPENKQTKPAIIKTKTLPEKPKPKPQMSLFDLLQEQPSTATNEKPTINESVSENINDKDDEPTEEEIREVMEEIAEEEKQKTIQPVGSPLYQNYIQLQKQYSNCILAYRLGDFYEVFGDNAKLLAEELNLTLTGRDCGLENRIPMIGFPYHASDVYFNKILQHGHKLAIAESSAEIRELSPAPKILPEPEKHWIDDKTYVDDDGVMHETDDEQDEKLAFDKSAFDLEALCKLDEIFGDILNLR